ncbi:MAG: hypothetical protein EB829_02260 [Nitrosopumilus sp. H8]|nr:MAG: hypothetical protein EB829_02260 [Nitrosopumilus sp. H8]
MIKLGSYEQMGICVAIVIVPSMLLLSQFTTDTNIIYPLLGLTPSILVPIIYDRIKQSRKRSKIRNSLKQFLNLIDNIDTDSEIYVKNTLEEIIIDLGSLGPYIQDSYDSDYYIAFMHEIRRLEQLVAENSPLSDLHCLALEIMQDLQRRY